MDISAVFYQEKSTWIAQALEYDIAAQADSLPELRTAFAMKLIAEMAICHDLGLELFEGIGPAPQVFWKMFQTSDLKVESSSIPVRVYNGPALPYINQIVKVGQMEKVLEAA